MKRTFLRILPLAVAVLLATSCSKDDNNTNEVVNNGQETVQTKTLPISITVNQKGLSKLSCANSTGVDLQPLFETSDKLAIYNGETFLTDLVIKEGSISQDGKSATFEGEITAEGIVDGTELIAKIGTPLTDAITATSREDAVQRGCYQISEPFVYSKDGNSIALEEQNSYIEVVWTNKGNASVEFTVNDSKTVTLQLNEQGQGWIVVPAGTTFTCAALGLTSEITTVAANIYGINREYKAVQSVTINNEVTEKVWGNDAFNVTVSILPADATNQTVTWNCTNATVTDNGNGTYSVMITGNTNGQASITATVDGVSSTAATITVPEDYVDLGTGVYWKTSDEGTYTFKNLPSGTPTKEQFSKLWDGTVTVSGTTFTNNNGSGASITLAQSSLYWSSTPYSSTIGWYVGVGSGAGKWNGDFKDNVKRVRLVRAAQ